MTANPLGGVRGCGKVLRKFEAESAWTLWRVEITALLRHNLHRPAVIGMAPAAPSHPRHCAGEKLTHTAQRPNASPMELVEVCLSLRRQDQT